MGEEAKHEEKPKEEVVVKEEEKKEEKTEENKTEEKKEEEEKKNEPKPAEPFVLSMDLHCMGCAKKIERTILKIRGVEGVVIEMEKNKVTIKGVVEPEAVCNIIMKKTKRAAKVVSPLPAAQGEPMPQLVSSQVSGLTTVELNVHMHCDACAEQLKRKILKMKGVSAAEADASSGKVTVTGTMDANKLVDYVYRRTKKQAKIVPQPEPEKPAEEAKPEEKKEEDKKEEGGEKPPEGEKKEGGDAPPEESKPAVEQSGDGLKEDGGGGGGEGGVIINNNIGDHEQMMHKMMYHYQQYQPLYMIERIPPPQLFSDENPNACCIT